MWSVDDIVSREQNMIFHELRHRLIGGVIEEFFFFFDELFTLEDIESATRKNTVVKTPQESVIINQFTPSGIDEDTPWLNEFNVFFTNKMIGFFGGRSVQGNNIRLGE